MVVIFKEIENGEYIEHHVRNHKINVYGKEKLIDCDGEYLQINIEIWEKMFNFVIDPIINHIEELLMGPLASKKFKYICLVGGLSCSKYFRSRIKMKFGLKSKYRLDLIVPYRPILSVVQGAAFLGITPNFVRARRLQFTYGVVVDKLKRFAVRDEVPDEYIEENEYLDEYTGKWKVRGCVAIMATKNEEVQLYGDEMRTKIFYRPHHTVKAVRYKIFCSKIEEPGTIEDGKVIGSMDIVFDQDLKNNEIMSKFIFSETLLKVEVWPKDLPNKRHEIKVNYNVKE